MALDTFLSSLYKKRRLLMFSLIMFFVYFSDVVMSYVSPIFIEEKMNSAFLMGLILSSSSVVGLVTDMIASKQFAHKEYRFFARWLIALALFFPLSLLVMPSQPLTFLIAMAVWGIYFEFFSFSQYNFVHKIVNPSQHTSAWSVIEVFKGMGCLVAPIAATYLLEISMETAMYAVIASLVIAAFLFFWYRKSFPEVENASSHLEVETKIQADTELHKKSFLQTLKIWHSLIKKIWPMYLFSFAFILLESAFWTVGPLLSEEIKKEHPLSGFLLSAYVLPTLITPPIAAFFSARFSKKEVAFVSAMLGSVVLSIGSFLLGHSPYLILFIFTSSLFFSLDYPEIGAIYEDYISRIDGYSNDLIGLQGSSTSLSYIIGPVVAGTLSSFVGNSTTLGIFAAFLGIVSLFLFITTPRKIRMPHQELATVSEAG